MFQNSPREKASTKRTNDQTGNLHDTKPGKFELMDI